VATNCDLTALLNMRNDSLSTINTSINDIECQILKYEELTEPRKDEYLLRAKIEFNRVKHDIDFKMESMNINQEKVTEAAAEGEQNRSKKQQQNAKKSSNTPMKTSDETISIRDNELIKEDIYLKWETKYLDDMDKYKLGVQDRTKLKSDKKKLELLTDKENNIQAIVSGLLTATSLIESKIKNAVKDRFKIKELLQSRVILDETGEVIANPHDKGNLAGMVEIIMSNYLKPSFVSFTNDVVETMRLQMNYNVTTNYPIQAKQTVDKIIATWESMNYWNYMTKDIFFTGILLRSLSQESDVTSKAAMDISAYVLEREEGIKRGEIDTCNEREQMPIYNHLSQYLVTLQKSMELKKRKGSHEDRDTRQKHEKLPGNVESAAKAETSESSNSDGMFRDSVTREMNVITTLENGITYCYTATKTECTLCKDGSNAHKPKCFLGKCKKCNSYGHKLPNCKQLPASYNREKQTANHAAIGSMVDREA
jgi:hypothetical protein